MAQQMDVQRPARGRWGEDQDVPAERRIESRGFHPFRCRLARTLQAYI